MQYTNNTDRTVALYNAMRLDGACANLAAAIRRAADTRNTAKITPKGRTLYSVRRAN